MNAKHLITQFVAASILAMSLQTRAQSGLLHSNQELHFVANKGQVKDQYQRLRTDIDYSLQVNSSFSLYVGKGLLQYQWTQSDKENASGYSFQRLDMQLVGANPKASVKADEQITYYEQYYLSGVATKANAYERLTYQNIYPNIDWVVYLKNNIAEYDFIVRPGGNVADIRLQYNGATAIRLNGDGSLSAMTAVGSVKESAPSSTANGWKISSAFVLEGNIVSFKTAPYTGTLVIDPALIWATYLGGLKADNGNRVATDKTGNVYMTGATASTTNIATTGSYHATYGGGTGGQSYVGDAFLAKYTAAGTPLWITYYGGTGADKGWSVVCDTANNVYMSGLTASTAGISTTGSHQAALGGGTDAFLVKFDSTGTRLWATYYGGSGTESNKTDLKLDNAGNVLMSGITTSISAIATPGAAQSILGGSTDEFLVKFNSNGVRQWATYYGGSLDEDSDPGMAVDRNNNIYLCGYTQSTSGIATTGSFQSTYGGGAYDGFLVRFTSAGTRQWATYYGGNDFDALASVAVNDSGFVYAAGTTASTNAIATTGAFLTAPNNPNQNALLVKFDSTGARKWGTYYGGTTSTISEIGGVAVSLTGNIYLSGYTDCTSFIATTGSGVRDTITGSYDAFVAKFSPSGSRLWGSYYGGTDNESEVSMTTDRFGNFYLCGSTTSGNNIATAGSAQQVIGGGYSDAFLVKINDCDTPAIPAPISGNNTVCKGGAYTYTTVATTGAVSYTWTLPGGWSGTSATNAINVQAGRDSGTIRVVANYACLSSPARTLQVNVSLNAQLIPGGSLATCNGDSIRLSAYNTGLPGTGYTYQWLNGNVALSGATDSVYYAVQPGQYIVRMSNGSCADTSTADTVIIHALPIPVITIGGNVMSTGSYASYQWNFNGTAITGATAQSYTALINGTYTVAVTDTNGCRGVSAAQNITGVGVNSLPLGNAIIFYPNPANNILHIQAPVPVAIKVFSVDGRIVLAQPLQKAIPHSSVINICVDGLADGLYIIHMLDANGNLLKAGKLRKQSQR